MKSSREYNINKLASKLGLVKKAGYTPPPSAMGVYGQLMHNKHEPKPDPLARKKVDRFKLDEARHGVKIPKYSLHHDEKLGVAYLIDENNNIVTLDDIKNHPLYGPAMLKHIAPELEGTAYKDLDEATKKKLGDYQDDARRSGRQFYVDDIAGAYEDGFDELENRYHNAYGAPLHSALANSEHKLKEGATPYIIGGDILSKLPVQTITDANGNKTKKTIVTPETVMQALVHQEAMGDALLENDLNRFFNVHYSPQEVFKYHDSGTLRYVVQDYFNPETGKFERQDLSDDDWTSDWDKTFNKEEAAKLYKPRDHFVPAYQQAVAIQMAEDKDTLDPFYEQGNLGHVLAGKDGISRLGGVKDYVDLGSYKDSHLQQLQEALGDKEAFQAAMDYVEQNNALNEWYSKNGIGEYGKINPQTGKYEGLPLPQNLALTMPQAPASIEGNAKAKLIYDFVSKNAEAQKKQGNKLSDLLSGKVKSLAAYDEQGNAIPMDLMRFSSMMNEGNANPVFVDHLGREFSKKPKYVPNFKTHSANQLLGVHDDLESDPANPYDLQRGFFSKNPAYAKYNADNPLVAMRMAKAAEQGLQMRQRSQNDSGILAGLLGQDVADFDKSLREKAHGASYAHTAKLQNLGLLLNDQTYRRNNYKDLSLALDNAATNRTFTSAATQNPLSKGLDIVGSGVGKGLGYAVGGVGSIFGQDWYDTTVPFFGGVGNLITDAIDPGHFIHGTMATATGAPIDRLGSADQNAWLQTNINDRLEKGFRDAGYNYSIDDYVNTSLLGNTSNMQAGDQASIFNDPMSLRAMSVLELAGPFMPVGGKAAGRLATPGLSTTSRISPMVQGSLRSAADDLAAQARNIDNIVLRSADNTQIVSAREAAERLGITTDELVDQLDNRNTYTRLFGDNMDGVADLRPGQIQDNIRTMYNGNTAGGLGVATADFVTLGGGVPNTLTGVFTNPGRTFRLRGMYDAQHQWAKNWHNTFNGTQPKKWYQLDLDGNRMSPFDTIDDQYRAFGKYSPNNLLWNKHSGGHSFLGDMLYNPMSPQRYRYPLTQYQRSINAGSPNQAGDAVDMANQQYVSLNDYSPEVMGGRQLSQHVTNPDAVAALNPKGGQPNTTQQSSGNGNFPWLALGLGAGAVGLGMYLHNKQKEEEEEKRKRQQQMQMQYAQQGQMYRPHMGRQYMR